MYLFVVWLLTLSMFSRLIHVVQHVSEFHLFPWLNYTACYGQTTLSWLAFMVVMEPLQSSPLAPYEAVPFAPLLTPERARPSAQHSLLPSSGFQHTSVPSRPCLGSGAGAGLICSIVTQAQG